MYMLYQEYQLASAQTASRLSQSLFAAVNAENADDSTTY